MEAAADIFIGRRTEISALRAAFDDARAGHGCLALIAGEPGIGKTRIALELANHTARQGARAVWGRCLEEPGAPPYWPWAQILRATVEPLTHDELTAALRSGAPEVASIVPDIAGRLPKLEALPVLSDPAQGRFRLFGAIARFLIAAARAQPLVLILDDLHWADVPSLRLLEFLAQGMADSRLLVVGTYRETELSRRHRLSDTLGALSRVPHLLRLPLSGLNADDVRRYVAASANLVPPESLTTAIHDQTEGNPLFVREVVRFLVQNGQLTAGSAIRLPAGVREVIGRRLNLLSQTCNDVLAVASVIGRGFSLDVLLKACRPRAGDTVLEALDEALAAHIVEETGPEKYQFTHALVRLTLYDELRIGQRRSLHHAAAEAIESVHRRDLESVAADLAFQFRASGLSEDIDRAIDYAAAAARRADKALAFEDTIGFCQNALDLLDTRAADDPNRRCGLLLLLGEAQRKAGDTQGAEATLKNGMDIARTNRLTALHGELVWAYCYTLYRNSLFLLDIGVVAPGIVTMLSGALDDLAETDAGLRIRIMALIARTRYNAGAEAAALSLATQTVAMARALGDPAVLAMVLYSVGTLRPNDAHELEQALADNTEIVALSTSSGQIEYASMAHSRLTSLHLERGDLKAAGVAMNAIDRTRAPTVFKRLQLSWMATFALMRGELDLAEQNIVQIMRIEGGEEGGNDPVSMLIFALRREQGRLGELGPLVSLFARQTTTPVWRPGLALMWLELGDRPAAKAVFDDIASADFADLPRDGRWTASVAFLAEVCAALGDKVAAAALYRLLLPWSDHNIVLGTGTGCYGSANRFLGMLAATMGDRTGAARHLEAAAMMNERIEAWLPLVHTNCDHAATLLDSDDRAGAARLLDQADDAAHRLGLPAVATRVTLLRARLDMPVVPAAVPDALTMRELEVLQLLAIGRSNADVALVLNISLNTVATHVRNILAKTGCANRTEAGVYAVRHGLARLGG